MKTNLTPLLFAMYYYQCAMAQYRMQNRLLSDLAFALRNLHFAIAVRLLRRYVELSHFDRATPKPPYCRLILEL